MHVLQHFGPGDGALFVHVADDKNGDPFPLCQSAAGLAVILALASSFRDRPLPHDLAAIGEVGLTGWEPQ